MKKEAFTLILTASFAFGFGGMSDFDQKVEDNLCDLYKQHEMAKYYGRSREARGIQKRIDSYKFRFGITEFDESKCFNGSHFYYPPMPYGAPNMRMIPQPYYNDEYEQGYNDGYRNGYQDHNSRRFDRYEYESRYPRY